MTQNHPKDTRKKLELSYVHSRVRDTSIYFVILHLAFFLEILYNYTIVLINIDLI